MTDQRIYEISLFKMRSITTQVKLTNDAASIPQTVNFALADYNRVCGPIRFMLNGRERTYLLN